MRVLRAVVAVLLVLGLAGCGGDRTGERATLRSTVQGQSMEPTLRRGDVVVVEEVEAGAVRRGDVVLYRAPADWLPPGTEDDSLIHRVIGLPGDTVVCCDAQGRLAVDGTALDEPYLAAGPGACNGALLDLWVVRPGTAVAGECRWTVGPVPEDRLFVLGDNRRHAADSRVHLCRAGERCPGGPWVPLDRVRGIVELPRAATTTGAPAP